MKNINQISLLLLFLLVRTISTAQTDEQLEKAKIAEKIYNKIANTIKDSRKQPTFNFIYNSDDRPYYNAYYSPTNNTINFGEGVYDIAARFGKDTENALAMVIGHELAHFYKDHSWGMAFGTSHDDLEISKKIYKESITSDKRAELETEADYNGGIYGYLSGYNTLAIGGEFFDSLYAIVGIPDETFGYPSRQDRVKIGDASKEKLQKLIPVFDAANYLVMLGQYEKAASLYDNVIETFPSRELYNNAGVALALDAVSLFEAEELKFIYPFGLDTDTRLDNGGQKGLSESNEEKRKRLLNEAIDMFNQSIKMDKEYGQAYVNVALAMELLGDNEMASAMASKGIQYSEEGSLISANGYIAKGIATAKEDKAKAKEYFNKATNGNAIIAAENLEVLKTGVFSKLFGKKKPSEEKESIVEESINEVDPSLMEVLLEDAHITSVASQNENKPKLKVYSTYEDDFTAILVKTYSYPRSQISFIITPDNFKGKSGRGVAIGDDFKLVQDKYGKPTKQVSGSQTNFHIYKKTGIIFKTDSNSKITGWILYAE